MSQEINLNFLKGLERGVVLDVLHRDQMLRKVDEERIRKLKIELQELRWRGAKSISQDYQQKSCARCQKALGMLINRGAVCNGCSHQVCSGCRITLSSYLWRCTVCYAQEDFKVKAGEWFFEERAKKFPAEGRHETAGAKLLTFYQNLSNISVVPPTPPPFMETAGEVHTEEHDLGKSFHRSMENLFLSLTTNIKKISKSQNDMTADNGLLTADYGQEMAPRKERRSQSDTAINIISKLSNAVSLPFLSGEEDDDAVASRRNSSKEGIPPNSIIDIFSARLRSPSLYSIDSTCTEAGNFEQADVSGEIELAVKYVFRSSILEVCIKACKDLAYGEEKKKKCNPYVKIYLLPDKSPRSKRKTSVKKNTVDPTFEEILKS
ncbi:synaptotagmin-like protein 3 isoform X2 [Hemicordylus capensis]|uniref:synaptotagmin-like protein 3 isoform X2 n=1 Tax=Hemicordylus capensis TaxID=884348 RepID=UPI002303038E|nr:synaptotagmin-like protein 3 isoform X2 [Hemicordylus capensis]